MKRVLGNWIVRVKGVFRTDIFICLTQDVFLKSKTLKLSMDLRWIIWIGL